MSNVVTIENAELERDAYHYESNLARLGDRRKFTWRCRECGSEFGMRGVDLETLIISPRVTLDALAPWYKDPGNDRMLYHPCLYCNYHGDRTGGMERLEIEDVLAWLNRNYVSPDQMAPDYAALAAEEPVS